MLPLKIIFGSDLKLANLLLNESGTLKIGTLNPILYSFLFLSFKI
jgi:hypothetical protein